MNSIIAILISLVYWIGFFIAYFIIFKPYDDSWKGWIKSASLSSIWFITIPLYFIKGILLKSDLDMKTNELMIGDWAHITDDDTDTYFDARVEAIDRAGNVYVKTPSDEIAYPYSVDCVEPIPLTSEILEKNKFKSWENGYMWKERVGMGGQTISATSPIEIIIYEGGHFVIMNPHEGKGFQGSIDYVHELQHALQLCGIDIKIKL